MLSSTKVTLVLILIITSFWVSNIIINDLRVKINDIKQVQQKYIDDIKGVD